MAFAIFGGLSPLIITLIIYKFNSILAPSFYLMGIALFSLIACGLFLPSIFNKGAEPCHQTPTLKTK